MKYVVGVSYSQPDSFVFIFSDGDRSGSSFNTTTADLKWKDFSLEKSGNPDIVSVDLWYCKTKSLLKGCKFIGKEGNTLLEVGDIE